MSEFDLDNNFSISFREWEEVRVINRKSIEDVRFTQSMSDEDYDRMIDHQVAMEKETYYCDEY